MYWEWVDDVVITVLFLTTRVQHPSVSFFLFEEMVVDQFAHCIYCDQRKGHKQNYFLIGQLLGEHGDVVVC